MLHRYTYRDDRFCSKIAEFTAMYDVYRALITDLLSLMITVYVNLPSINLLKQFTFFNWEVF